MSISAVAQSGFASSDQYDTHRPSYPSEALDRFLEVLEIKGKRRAKVLDVGAGTGKFTQLLSSRDENFQITAVEPHDGMRKELDAKQFKNVTVMNATAEKMEQIPDQTFDAVTVAQAFHWMANMDTLRELHRVLKPTAVLGIIWNVEDYQAPKSWEIHGGWQSTMRDVMTSPELEDGSFRFRDMKWKEVFDEQGRSNPLTLHFSDPLFGLPVGEESVEFTRWLSKDDIWSTFKTYSQVANLDSDQLAQVEQTFWKAMDSAQTDVQQHKVAVNGRTVLVWTSKIPDAPLRSGG